MAKKRKNFHIGGQQMPLLVPDSDWQMPSELPDLRKFKRIALDRETKDDGLANGRGPGWAFGAGYICGVSAAWKVGNEFRSFYAPVAHPDSECFDGDAVRRWELDHQKAGVEFVMQNAPYDVGWGNRQWDIPCPKKIQDTTCMAYLIDESRRGFDLDSLCAWRGLPGKDERLLREAAEVYGIDPKSELYKLPSRFVGQYAEMDAVRTLQIAESMEPELDEQGLRRAYQLEMDLVPMVHAMRKRGVRVEMEGAERARLHCLKVSEQAFRDLSDKLGQTVGIDEARSNSWLERAFDSQKLTYPRDQFTGRASFEAKWMSQEEHWLPLLLVRGKSYRDAADKFIRNFIMDFAHADASGDSRLHASINQFKSEDGGTRTSRFSYSDPPLQQMPNRNEELAKLIRGSFLPEEGELWLSADYSQQEYRLIVHFAERQKLAKAKEAADKYRNDPSTDFHSMVAELTGLARKPAKDTNFAKSYGAGVPKFAAMINKSVEEAEAIMKQYDERMPFVKQMNEMCQSKAERTGYIKLMDGARIHFNNFEPTWLSAEERARGWGSNGRFQMNDCDIKEAKARVADKDHPWYGKRLRRSNCRKAMNALIQGNAARQTKLAMRACWQEKLIPLLQMHDELAFSVTEKRTGEKVSQIMREVVKLRVPMKVDAEYGRNWGDATHSWEEVAAA